MARVKRGAIARQRRRKVLKLSKGYWGRRSKSFRPANQQVMRSLMFAYRDRRVRKREFRKLWITRINAAARLNGISYSRFISGLENAGVEVNRKVLADIAVKDPEGFGQLVATAKEHL